MGEMGRRWERWGGDRRDGEGWERREGDGRGKRLAKVWR